MPVRQREGVRPGRRIAPANFLSKESKRALLSRLQYVGSGLHKRFPGNYGFVPSHNPRPSKSLCDGIRSVPIEEAKALFQRGVEFGMISEFQPGQAPKYVWAVDGNGDVYEAKTHPEREVAYHGYRLGDDEIEMRSYILKIWRQRCP